MGSGGLHWGHQGPALPYGKLRGTELRSEDARRPRACTYGGWKRQFSISVPLRPRCPQRERGSRPQRPRAGAGGGGGGGGGRSPLGGGHFRPRAQSRSTGRAAATPTRKRAWPRAGLGRLHNGGGGACACVTRRLPAAPAAPYITGVRAAARPQ